MRTHAALSRSLGLSPRRSRSLSALTSSIFPARNAVRSMRSEGCSRRVLTPGKVANPTESEEAIAQREVRRYIAAVLRRRSVSALLTLVSVGVTPLRAQEAPTLYGSAHPRLTDSLFFGAPAGDAYVFGVRLQSRGNDFVALTRGMGTPNAPGYFEVEATTYPPVNRLDSAADRRAQLAFAQAYWNIARYHAARTQARLRREVGFPNLFRLGEYVGAANRAQEIWNANQAEWDAAVDDLGREASETDPVLRSQAFAEQYAAALDTVDMPRLAYGPHGAWIYVAFGAFAPLGTTNPDASGAGAGDVGFGYRNRRLRLGLALHFGFFEEAAADPTSPLVDDRGRWETVAGLVGYDLWRDARFAVSTHAYLGATSVKTGSGDEEDLNTLARGFTPGLSVDLRTRLGRKRDPSYYSGLTPRQPLTLFARVTALRQKSYTDESVVGVSAVAGMYIDVSSFRYEP